MPFRTAILTSALTLGLCATAFAADIPELAEAPLRAAYESKNEFVMGAVAQRVKQEFALTQEDIDAYLASLQAEAIRVASIAPAAGDKEKGPISGDVEAGFNLQNGNTKEEEIRFAGTLNYEPQDTNWANTTTFLAENNKSNGSRSNEEYRLGNQTRWKFSEKEYAFLELDYVSDRFGGFDSRFSQSIGYGRELYANESFTWGGEIGAGARQTKLTNGDKEESVLGTIKTTGDWKITETLHFKQVFQSEFTSDNVISESDSELKSDLTDNLYLSLGLNVEHVSDAPAGSSQTDTRTRAAIGYKF